MLTCCVRAGDGLVYIISNQGRKLEENALSIIVQLSGEDHTRDKAGHSEQMWMLRPCEEESSAAGAEEEALPQQAKRECITMFFIRCTAATVSALTFARAPL